MIVPLDEEQTRDLARYWYDEEGAVWGTEPRAMRVEGEYHDEVFMALKLDD